ncbi:hypothetical protein AB1Y20_020172 [Prymnesium parvum]|uniref:Phosphatidylinositol-3-phosphatase n=1 Tax=Prymnesium parvum TaxID=97485 RepID=A0AB34JWG3_PRYPA
MLMTVKKVGKGVGSLFALSTSDEGFSMFAHDRHSELTIHVLSATELLSSDANGLSDPYVVIRVGEARQWRSAVISRTLNPVWDEQQYTFEQPPSHLLWLVLEVWDSDVASTDDPLGRCLLPVQQLLEAKRPVDVPLGRESPRHSAKGQVTVQLRCSSLPAPERTLPDGSFKREAAGKCDLPADAARFAAHCLHVDSAPRALRPPAALAERLEVCIRSVIFSALGSHCTGDLFVSNVRLLFAPDVWSADAAAHEGAARMTHSDASLRMSSKSVASASSVQEHSVSALHAIPLHSIMRVEAAGDGHTSSYLRLLLSTRHGDRSAAGSGGVLHLHLLPANEVSILFCAATHGAGSASVCSQLMQRLSFAAANAERAYAPLWDDSPGPAYAPLWDDCPGPSATPPRDPEAPPRSGGAPRGWDAFDAAAEWARLAALVEPPRAELPAEFFGGEARAGLAASGASERERKESSPIHAWRITAANAEYALCPSYPCSLIVPSYVDDALLKVCAKFRSKGRVPCLTWLHANGAALCRSAQPLSGLGDRRCVEDEQLLQAVAASNPSGKPLIIVDCRSRVATLGNAAMGKGTESEAHYAASVVHLNIANIHAVREAFLKVHELTAKGDTRDSSYLRSLDETGWLHHVASLLRGAIGVSHALHIQRRSVLVHCSDGWDRTAQVCILAQLLLDPFFRTIDGFMVLIDKDIVAFGHKCSDRLGYTPEGHTNSDWSPIILQLLDAVHQVVAQYPHAFEFNAAMLQHIAYQLYTGFVGNFLHNSERSRRQSDVQSTWPSLWTSLAEARASYCNAGFEEWPLSKGPLVPASSIQRLRVWDALMPPLHLAAAQTLQEVGWWQAGMPLDHEQPLRAEPTCRASVFKTSRQIDLARGTEFTLYHIAIEAMPPDDGFVEIEAAEDQPAAAPQRVEIAHRFSDFHTLDSNLRSSSAFAMLPPSIAAFYPSLPTWMTPVAAFYRMSDSLVASRKLALDRYVAALVLIPELTCLAEVDAFFGGFFTQPGVGDVIRSPRSPSPQFAVID